MELKAIPQSALPVTELQVKQPLKGKAQLTDKDRAAAHKVATEFESMFVAMMLKSMRATVGEDKLTGGGHGEETYRSLLDEQYAVQAAKNGSLGLAAGLERELTRYGGQPKEKSHAD